MAVYSYCNSAGTGGPRGRPLKRYYREISEEEEEKEEAVAVEAGYWARWVSGR